MYGCENSGIARLVHVEPYRTFFYLKESFWCYRLFIMLPFLVVDYIYVMKLMALFVFLLFVTCQSNFKRFLLLFVWMIKATTATLCNSCLWILMTMLPMMSPMSQGMTQTYTFSTKLEVAGPRLMLFIYPGGSKPRKQLTVMSNIWQKVHPFFQRFPLKIYLRTFPPLLLAQIMFLGALCSKGTCWKTNWETPVLNQLILPWTWMLGR